MKAGLTARIAACRSALDETADGPVPLFVGGGIRTPEQASAARAAGAMYVVVGTVVEQGSPPLREFVDAITT